MSKAFLFDANAAIALLNRNTEVEKIVNAANEIYVPIIVVGELYFGAENSGRVAENREKVDSFAARYAILNCDHQTAGEYGLIAQRLRAKGRPIRQNDMWIAAIALQHGLALLTKDAHFNDIDGLSVQAW